MPLHVRFEGVLWLQAASFRIGGHSVAPKRLLMLDDLHKLRRKQHALLIDELTVLRPTIPVLFAERSTVLGEHLVSQGPARPAGGSVRRCLLGDRMAGFAD
jgi:hypothetical protein